MINIFKIGIFKKMLSSRLGQVLFEGKPKPGVIYVPYGMFANVQENIPTGVLLDQGNEESLLFLPFDIENRETLSKNEVGFGIPSEENRLYFRNGKITFKIDDTEGGDFAVRFTALETAINSLVTSIDSAIAGSITGHTHISNGPAVPTAPGVGAAPPVVSDISSSKIDKIEFPS